MVTPPSKFIINRRDFLRQTASLSGAAALASFLEGCARAGLDPEAVLTGTSTAPARSASSTSMPPSTAAPVPAVETVQPAQTSPAAASAIPERTPDGRARLAFVKTGNRAEGVRRALDLLGINPAEGKAVFLKPNFNSADPAPGSTHPDVLTTLVKWLQEKGARQVTLGDRSGMGNTRQVMEQLGVFRLAAELGIEALVFDELPADAWVKVQPSGSHWNDGFYFARPCLDADVLVEACCLKTHRYGGHFTLSLKNFVGLAAQRLPQESHNYMQELHNSAHQRRMIAEINTACAPALIVMDGVEAFISGGPDVGEKVNSQVVLAGSDRVAMDAAGVALLRYHGCRTEAGQGRIFDQEQIARAVELGLGVDSPEKIELITGDPESAAYSQEISALLVAG